MSLELPRRPLGILLKHQYPLLGSQDAWELKDADRIVYEAAGRLGLAVTLQPVVLQLNLGCRRL